MACTPVGSTQRRGQPPGESERSTNSSAGKWHLGSDDAHDPLSHGFRECFGFLGGSNRYLTQGVVPNIVRGPELVREAGYLTDAFGREAVAFIDRHRQEPFFLYLAFHAPHGPLEASEKARKRFVAIGNPKRRTYAAVVSAMDDGIGGVLEALRAARLEEDTLVVFISDNGGPTEMNTSSNAPLRGVKGEVREEAFGSHFSSAGRRLPPC